MDSASLSAPVSSPVRPDVVLHFSPIGASQADDPPYLAWSLIYPNAASNVHLFVRAEKRRAGRAASPFFYCGPISFVGWEGEAPPSVN